MKYNISKNLSDFHRAYYELYATGFHSKVLLLFGLLLLEITKWPVCNMQDSTNTIVTDLLA